MAHYTVKWLQCSSGRSIDGRKYKVHHVVTKKLATPNAIRCGMPLFATQTAQSSEESQRPRVLSSTHKYDRGLSRLLHSEALHWIVVPESVQYKLGVVMYSCLHSQSQRYLADLCVPVSDVSARQHLLGVSWCSAMPAQHTRSTGLLCGRPVTLELSTRQLRDV